MIQPQEPLMMTAAEQVAMQPIASSRRAMDFAFIPGIFRFQRVVV